MAKKKAIPKRRTPTPTIKGPKRRKYKRNFLSKVIARVDFTPHLGISFGNLPEPLPAALKKRFSLAEHQVSEQPELEVSRGDRKAQAKFSLVRRDHWQFHSTKRDRYIEISESSLLINYTTYDCFESLLDDFLPAVEHFLQPVSKLNIHRLGLRYIDSFDFSDESNPTEWSKYLHGDLLTTFNLADNRKTVSRAFNILEFNYGDTNLRFQYGMPNPDYPAAIKKKLYVLDWDAYSMNLGLRIKDVKSYLTRYHDKINTAFEEVITDNLRKKMNA
jgi:uncharacterized protein (TIGR04255 family)